MAASKGVSGLRTSPALRPAVLMRSKVWAMEVLYWASRWMLMLLAPAAMKRSR